MPEKKVYSLSALTRSIEQVINAHCNKVVWIKAEIVKLNYYPKSGHCYPTLVEKKNGKVIAELRGNIWAAQYGMINAKFKSVLKEELKDDMTVVIQGSITYSPVHGLALNIIDIDPEFTLGELAREKAETIAKLKAAEIFDLNKQKDLPELPKTIAIISVETSKGYGDFMDVIKKNTPGFQFHFLLFPAILQGERAVGTINQQLEKIRAHTEVFDAVAIIRGGGGEIGLSCFDNYFLAEKIATFPIPVLTGIGHSTNTTVSELVSYESFITPTKIAEFLLQKFKDFDFGLKGNSQKIQNQTTLLLNDQKKSLRESARLFSSLTGNAMNTSRSNLDRILYRLENAGQRSFTDQKNRLENSRRSILGSVTKPLEEAEVRLLFTSEKIKMLSPENILKRGYSITRQNGKIIKDIEELIPEVEMETLLYGGKVFSRIEKTENKNVNE